MLAREGVLRSWRRMLPALALLLGMALVGGQVIAGMGEAGVGQPEFAPVSLYAQGGHGASPLTPLDTPTITPTPTCPPSWSVISSPHPGTGTNGLNDVA